MIDLILHALGGAAIVAVAAAAWPAKLWVSLAASAAALAFGIARESWQRDWKSPLQFSAHAWTEATAWGVGGLMAAAILPA